MEAIAKAFEAAEEKRSLDEKIKRLDGSEAWRVLTVPQKRLVAVFLASGDPLKAVKSAYHAKDERSYRSMSVGMFKSERVHTALCLASPEYARDAALAELMDLIENPQTTMPQIEAMKLRLQLLGILPTPVVEAKTPETPVEAS